MASTYSKTYTTYSGVDIVATMTPTGGTPVVVGEIQTISYSIHRDRFPVRTLGRINPMGFCLPETAKVLIKDKGYISIKDVVAGDFVQSDSNKYNKVLASYKQPEKQCFEISTQNKYSIQASYDHPIMTDSGWKKAEDIVMGDSLRIINSAPTLEVDYDIPDDILIMIAYLIGDGAMHQYAKDGNSTEHRLSICIGNNEIESIGKDIEHILDKLDIEYKDYPHKKGKCLDRRISICQKGCAKTDWRQRKYNELHKWVLKLGLYDTYSHNKFIPQEFLANLSKRQIALFLNRLYATDGCYAFSVDLKDIAVSYCTTSKELAIGIRLLLNKMSIPSIISLHNRKGKMGGKDNIISQHDAYSVEINDGRYILKFYNKINIFSKEDKLTVHYDQIKRKIKNYPLSLSMKDFTSLCRDIIKKRNGETKKGIGLKEFTAKFNLCNYKLELTPRRALMVADYLQDKTLLELVNQLVDELIEEDENCFYYKVVEIKNLGILPTYNLTVEESGSFVSNFILVHNTTGGRTVAGSLIFTVFDRHLILRLVQAMNGPSYSTLTQDDKVEMITNMKMDELPPIDVTIHFANEYGNKSQIRIYGVVFVDEGQVMSIEDMITEQTMSYMAQDIELIQPGSDFE
jgi:intein/homing endonuclease